MTSTTWEALKLYGNSISFDLLKKYTFPFLIKMCTHMIRQLLLSEECDFCLCVPAFFEADIHIKSVYA